MTPLVTVGLPVYNAEQFLVECLESIKAQTMKEFAVLAILDCPTDNSADLLRKHVDYRFKVIENPRNLGLAGTCNRMLELCETELLARMDADDVMHPERLENQYRFMQSNPDIDVLGTYFDTIDEHGVKTAEPHKFCLTPEEIREEYRIYPALHHPTLMYRVKRVKELGGYFSKYSEDNVLWLKGLSQEYRYANLPDVLLHYRVHSKQVMSRLREPTLAALDRAYADYGPLIWGNRAPKYVAGATRAERMKRRIKRKLPFLFPR